MTSVLVLLSASMDNLFLFLCLLLIGFGVLLLLCFPYNLCSLVRKRVLTCWESGDLKWLDILVFRSVFLIKVDLILMKSVSSPNSVRWSCNYFSQEVNRFSAYSAKYTILHYSKFLFVVLMLCSARSFYLHIMWFVILSTVLRSLCCEKCSPYCF
jgi:hypothetical protein